LPADPGHPNFAEAAPLMCYNDFTLAGGPWRRPVDIKLGRNYPRARHDQGRLWSPAARWDACHPGMMGDGTEEQNLDERRGVSILILVDEQPVDRAAADAVPGRLRRRTHDHLQDGQLPVHFEDT
jgi:hypothetical protein